MLHLILAGSELSEVYTGLHAYLSLTSYNSVTTELSVWLNRLKLHGGSTLTEPHSWPLDAFLDCTGPSYLLGSSNNWSLCFVFVLVVFACLHAWGCTWFVYHWWNPVCEFVWRCLVHLVCLRFDCRCRLSCRTTIVWLTDLLHGEKDQGSGRGKKENSMCLKFI